MTTDLDRIRLAAAAELERFEADERRRLAYADRAETLEVRDEEHDPGGHCRDRNCDYEVGGRWSCEYPPICTPPLADGTGRHSRKEMEQATTWKRFTRQCNWCQRIWSFDGDHDDITHCPGCGAEANPVAYRSEPPTQTVAGVQFSSVPALCAFVEQLLSASAAYLWSWRPDREHCSGPQLDVYRELRRLVAGAGKDVP